MAHDAVVSVVVSLAITVGIMTWQYFDQPRQNTARGRTAHIPAEGSHAKTATSED